MRGIISQLLGPAVFDLDLGCLTLFQPEPGVHADSFATLAGTAGGEEECSSSCDKG